MRAIDTNVLLRLAIRDEATQLSAAEAFVAGGVWVPHMVLAEAIWVMTAVYELGPKETATAIEMFLSHRDLTIQDSDAVAAALKQYRKKHAPGFSDCLILELSRKAGHLPLGTFDRDLGRLDGAQRL